MRSGYGAKVHAKKTIIPCPSCGEPIRVLGKHNVRACVKEKCQKYFDEIKRQRQKEQKKQWYRRKVMGGDG